MVDYSETILERGQLKAQVPIDGVTAELILARVNFPVTRTNQELGAVSHRLLLN